MRHGDTWSLNSQVEKFGPISISKGTIFSGDVNFSFFKGRLIEQLFVLFNKRLILKQL